jgi:hypothetical protein
MNSGKNKKTRIIAGVIAAVLVLTMVGTLLASAVM